MPLTRKFQTVCFCIGTVLFGWSYAEARTPRIGTMPRTHTNSPRPYKPYKPRTRLSDTWPPKGGLC